MGATRGPEEKAKLVIKPDKRYGKKFKVEDLRFTEQRDKQVVCFSPVK
jgi:hypothetical protein